MGDNRVNSAAEIARRGRSGELLNEEQIKKNQENSFLGQLTSNVKDWFSPSKSPSPRVMPGRPESSTLDPRTQGTTGGGLGVQGRLSAAPSEIPPSPFGPKTEVATQITEEDIPTPPPGVEMGPLTEEEAMKQTVALIRQNTRAQKKDIGNNNGKAGIGSKEKDLRAAIGLTDPIAAPSDISKALTQAQEMMKGLNAGQKEWFEAQRNKIDQQATELYTEIKRAQDLARTEKERDDLFVTLGQGLEVVGQNLVRLFAANYGLKKGVDLSGLRFDKFDWEKTQARFDNRFDKTMQSLSERLQEADKERMQGKQALNKQQAETEQTLIKEGAGLYEKALGESMDIEMKNKDIELANKRMTSEDSIKRAQLRQDLEIAKMRDLTEREKIAALSNKQDQAQRAKASGDLVKQQAAVREKFAAINGALGTSIGASMLKDFPGAGKNMDPMPVSIEHISEALKESKDTFTKAGIDPSPIVNKILDPGGFFRSGKATYGDLKKALAAAAEEEVQKLGGQTEPTSGTMPVTSEPTSADELEPLL